MKVLFITRFDFTGPHRDGGVLGTYRNYSMLCKIYGNQNIIACILTPDNKEDKNNIKYFKVEKSIIKIYLIYLCLGERYSKKQKEKIVGYICSQKIDRIFFDGSTFGQIIKTKSLKSLENIVFFHNVERQYTWDQVKKYNVLCIFRYISTRYNERIMAKYAKKIICLNERDQKLIWRYYHRIPDMILPVTFDDQYNCSEKKSICLERKKLQLLYVGSYIVHNYTGLIWFVKSVLPYIDADLTIVGKDMEKLIDKVPNIENLYIIGTVDEVCDYYEMADAVVMPIFMGGGMKLKTAEAFMYGKNVFASKEALEGYDVDGVEGIYRCDSKEDFIQKINNYAQHWSVQTKKVNENVRRLFLDKYCTQSYLNYFQNIIDHI